MADLDVVALAAFVPASNEMLADARDFRAAVDSWMSATPEERQQWADEAKQQRAREREVAERRPLTLDAVLDKLSFSREYAEHLVQPYCECWDGMDGWEYCQHARDEGLTR